MASKPSLPLRVQHVYRDHANVTEDELEGIAEMREAKNSGGPRSDRTFPIRLHYLLSELERDGLDHIIGWQLHGRCFVIRKPQEFVDVILPVSTGEPSVANSRLPCRWVLNWSYNFFFD